MLLPHTFINKIKDCHSRLFLVLFYLYLFLLPLPLGSNRPIAWHAEQIFIFCLLLVYFILHSDYLLSVISKHRIPLGILSGTVIWIAFQLMPLPVSLLAILSPGFESIFDNTATSFAPISLDFQATTDALLKALSYLCVFILALAIITSPKRLISCLVFVVVTGTLNGFYGAFEILSGQDFSLFMNMENGHRANGTFVYHNHFANFLFLCLSAGLGYFIATLTQRKAFPKQNVIASTLQAMISPKSAIRLCLTIMVIALVMSHSRMGNTAFFASLFIVSVLYMFIGKQVPGGFKLLVLSMFLIDIFVVSSWFGLEKVRDRLEATSLATESRDEVVFDTVDIIKEFPVTGTGAGSYETVFASFQSNNVNANYDHAHNDYLEFSLEYGLPVTLLLGLLLCFICAISIKTLSKAKDRRLAGTAAAALMAVVGMLMHMSVDFPLVAPANSSFFILLLALACIAHNFLNNELNPAVNHNGPV